MKNTLEPELLARQPRGIVQINGVTVPFLTWQIDSNIFFAADTFRMTLPVDTLPAAAPLSLLFGTGDLEVEIFAGFPHDPNSFTTADLTSLFLGRADEVTWNLGHTELEISGRDFTGKLIDVKTSEKYVNQTASQIVTKLAGQYGLTPVVTATTIPVGTFYTQDHVRLQDDRTVWDLITWLAKESGFVAYVEHKELHFEPAPTTTQDPYVFQFVQGVDGPSVANACEIKVSHAKTLAKDVIVKVHSWNRKSSHGFTVTAKASHTRSGTTSRGSIRTGQPQVYDRTVANKTVEEAQRIANALLSEISRHEVKLEVEGPADNVLTRTDVIQLQGTNTPVDGFYYPYSIVREMDFEGGYRWEVFAKNHNPESDATL